MSKRLGQTPFREILPDSISGDETVSRIAAILDGPLDGASRSIPELPLYARLANDAGLEKPVPMLPPLERLAALSSGLKELPEAVLDLLAWQLHVERYETAASLQAKRAMVFASVILHRKRGTPWAVRHGLETTLQVPAKISEWFEYGGEPYFFRVYLDVSGAEMTAQSVDNAVAVIMAHKNVRSWLEFLRTKSIRKIPAPIGAATLEGTRAQLYSWRWRLTGEPVKSPGLTGSLEKTKIKTGPAQRLPDAGSFRLPGRMAGNAITRSNYAKPIGGENVAS